MNAMTDAQTHVNATNRRIWRAPEERDDVIRTKDEFGPEVARAIAELRTAHGYSNVSCQTEGNNDTADNGLAELRREWQTTLPAVNRRGFMQLTGAAAVFALAGCYKKHPDTLVPYAHQPENITLGKAVYYSSTIRDSGRPVPVMVKTYDGRPIKIEGNPDVSITRGTADVHTQASLLNLYDPDRWQHGAMRRQGNEFTATTWAELDAKIGEALKSGGRIGLITGPIDGFANRALVEQLTSAFASLMTHGIHDTRADNAFAASRGAVRRDISQAQTLVTFGGDYLADVGLDELVAYGNFRRLRGKDKNQSAGQVISFEAVMSQTGAAADIRVRIAPDRLAHAAWGIAEIIAKATNQSIPPAISEQLQALRAGKSLADALGLKMVHGKDALQFVAERLLALREQKQYSLIYAAPHGTASAGVAPLMAAVHVLNQLLGNEGQTVVADGASTVLSGGSNPVAPIYQAAARGEISTLIFVGVNPVFDIPALAGALEKVKTVVVLADRIHETAQLAHYYAPTLHSLESWGDAELRPGIYTLQQPCLPPLWDARAAEESLMAFTLAAGAKVPAFAQAKVDVKNAPLSVASAKPLWVAAANGVQSWQRFVQNVWTTQVKNVVKAAADDRSFWQAALARGVVTTAAAGGKINTVTVSNEQAVLPKFAADGTLQLVISPSRVMGDGTWLNNAWLMEIPDPVSKITWDNYLALSAVDAKRLDIKADDVVELKSGAVSLQLPVHIQEGQHPGTVQTFSGWGRAKDCAGEVANFVLNDGFSVAVNTLVPGTTVELVKTGKRYQIANVQGHNRMQGRDIALDDVLELHVADPGGAKRKHHRALWEKGTDGKPHGRLSVFGSTHDYVGHKWGMSVDLSTCTGCNACVVACNAENNIPVVGRDEVRRGRELHWMRIDRYYVSDGDDTDMLDVDVIQQPVMCQQCDNAPCEEACPAMATMHNDEGINVMVYNRCIGTRYCSNNCPYKARRFNWYEYGKYRFGPQGAGDAAGRIVKNLITSGATSSQAELTKHPLEMALNPEVTVRSRGVMEKCNFCIQRTREIRDIEKRDNRKIRDGELTTACAQTCPTQAIVFGDLNDPESQVTKIATEAHSYKLLDSVLNTRPAVTYLARIRNRPATADEMKKLSGDGHASGHTAGGAH
jgi:Fe-S-cluster-containing dehydrogenase component/anaerobic selenocysteine-containing dehydrogenase